jgi:transcriptional regulator with XRE-family HTH domain
VTSRQQLAHLATEDANELIARTLRELRAARRALAMSQGEAGRRAGMSRAQFGRLERGEIAGVSVEQLCRAGRAVGLKAALTWHPVEIGPRDRPQLAVFDRLGRLLGPPLILRREVTLPIRGDQRAWDGRIETPDGRSRASVEVESRLHDTQALARRIALKQRDDPLAGVVILVVNRTAHNRRVLADHREALRNQFPLDGAPIARALRAGLIPPASGIILV